MATEGQAFTRVLQQSVEALHDDMLGLRRVEGLSFKVVPYMLDLFRGPRVVDRPFTYREHRRHIWRTRRRRWKFRLTHPPREAKRRLGRAWDALRGREDEGWY